MKTRTRAGSALLEVIAALTILVISAVAGASLLAHLSHTVATTEHTDRETAAAEAVIARVSMWPRAQLEEAIGENRRDGFLVTVQRLAPTLYQVDVRDAASRTSLVASVFYRRGGENAPRS